VAHLLIERVSPVQSTDGTKVTTLSQGPGPTTLGADWQRVVWIHEGLMPLENLQVGDTFVPLSADDGYVTVDVLTSSEAYEIVRAQAPDAVLEWGNKVRAKDIHPVTLKRNSVCRAVWSNELAVVVGIDLQLRTATVIIRRGREYTMRVKRFRSYEAKPEVLEFQVG
jgi:hypothetical protein